jgi:hypothetical protein
MKKFLLATTLAIALTGMVNAMGTMVNRTGPHNYNCEVFQNGKPRERANALIFAQGYAAALNMELLPTTGKTVSLWDSWREFNAIVIRLCTDKSNEYLYRRFVNDAAWEALNIMSHGALELRTTEINKG